MTAPEYNTPRNQTCPECGEPCQVVPLLNDFDYGEGHHGKGGTEYPIDWGNPVSSCCDAEIDGAARCE